MTEAVSLGELLHEEALFGASERWEYTRGRLFPSGLCLSAIFWAWPDPLPTGLNGDGKNVQTLWWAELDRLHSMTRAYPPLIARYSREIKWKRKLGNGRHMFTPRGQVRHGHISQSLSHISQGIGPFPLRENVAPPDNKSKIYDKNFHENVARPDNKPDYDKANPQTRPYTGMWHRQQ